MIDDTGEMIGAALRLSKENEQLNNIVVALAVSLIISIAYNCYLLYKLKR